MEVHEKEMDRDELLNTMKELNPDLKISLNCSKLKKDLEIIFSEFEKIEEFCSNKDNTYDLDKLNNSSDKKENENKLDYFLIAKLIYYNKKCFNFIPRDIQIISLICFLEKEKDIGLIQQIDTGEGKSCIISFLAVYIAKKKKKDIDILTSSPILAKRDALLYKDFYKSFNLTVDYVSDHNEEVIKNNIISTLDPYNCYRANIVYGDALCFEGDILRTYFMQIKGRGIKRNFNCIIIDEIDNIALDNLKNTTELLDSFQGYKFLEYVYFFIYKKLKEITNNKENVQDEKDKIINDLKKECSEEFKNLKVLREKKNIFIPYHLKDYINYRLDDWCESAYLAKFVYEDNENYIKKLDENYKMNIINPIDFYNTGVTQENSVWAGLHQFLQIDEKLMITEDNLSSCYMSNLSFFNKYIELDKNKKIKENNIYGLTGTIGSEYNKTTLKALYNLYPIIIPPFRKSLLKIEEPNIIIMKKDEKSKELNNKNQLDFEAKWFNNIKNKIIEMIERERAVLVIFQYISQVEKMKNQLDHINKNFKIISYSRSDLNEDTFLKYYIKPRTVILSTNLSGRGTDIRISPELNKKGGLHVILTYEPFNQRIERQAFGRAGRKGENGSAGKIVISSFTKEEAIKEMDKREKEESEFVINVYKEKIYSFERMFNKFSEFISDVKKKNDNNNLLSELKERWGLFLIENSMNNIEKKYKKDKKIDPNVFKKIENNYYKFEEDLRSYEYKYDNSSKNVIIKKFKNMFRDNNNNNKKVYKFKNGLYLNRENDIDKINKGIKLCPVLSLGGYMFKIIINMEKIISFNLKDIKNNKINEIYVEEISTIEENFKILINNISLLLKQFGEYTKILEFLGYNEKMEIFKQNEQKIILMNSIKKLMTDNEQTFQKYREIRKLTSLFIDGMKLDEFIKSEKININKLVYEYFLGYGFRLFRLKENDSCLIY